MQSYEALKLALSGAGVSSESAELHGGLCASLCVGGLPASDAWAADWLGAGSEADLAAARGLVQEVEQDSWRAMTAGDFQLELILPDDDTDLTQRVAGLAAWCHGFVSGLGVAGLSLAEHAPSVRAQLEEIIGDFGEIARASTDVEDVVEGGFQLASIVEFVRAGVQIVFESLAEQRNVRITGRLH
jgi:uncharacterized protein YgfB (UPF0149 family)